MAGFLKSIFGKKEEIHGPLELALGEVPAWLDAREQEVHGELDAMVLASRERALLAIATLKAQVGDLASLQPPADQVMNPKLRRVVEQGIPRFIAAMEKTLDTRLSMVPGEYYDDCVGIIAGTAKNMKGPGRYIASVYPREMKEIRASLDIIGRDVNALGKRLGPARTEDEAIASARSEVSAIEAAIAELRLLGQNETELLAVIGRENADLAVGQETLAGLMEGDEKKAADALSAEIACLEEKGRAITGEFEQLRSRSANVFRKAVHAAESEGDATSAEAIEVFQASLTTPEAVDAEKTVARYRTLYPALMALTKKHDGIIKNRDEEELFSDPDHFIARLTALSGRWEENSARLRELRERHAATGVSRRIAEAGKAVHVIEVRKALDEKLLSEAREKMQTLKAEIPVRIDDLQAMLTAIRNEDAPVILHAPSPFSEREGARMDI
jgi:hypothetical protein